jgi:hypothetical protein
MQTLDQLTKDQRKALANQLKENPLLAQIVETLERDLILAWKAAQNLNEREALHAKVSALLLLRGKIDAAVKRELGDKQANTSTSV